ncbi:hypothetical protein ES703_25836 [subsurface metagenome]
MHLRLKCKGVQFYAAVTYSKKVKGVNSILPNGRHFLLFDFDDVEEHNVKASLRAIQARYKLSSIYLINTGLTDYWHAYCFTSHSWPETLRILADTPALDKVYFKIGVLRGYFTLRYSPKQGRVFSEAQRLSSEVRADVDPYELDSFINYWTKRL